MNESWEDEMSKMWDWVCRRKDGLVLKAKEKRKGSHLVLFFHISTPKVSLFNHFCTLHKGSLAAALQLSNA